MGWPFTNSNYPTVQYPTIIRGKVCGPVRCESLDGSEMWLPAGVRHVLPTGEMIVEKNATESILDNFGPFQLDGKMWGVSHLQKKSSRGWLKVAPDCYHQWYFWKPQQQNEKGDWIPDSESGIYFRRPFSWRWDIAGTNLDGALRHWVWTKGYLGGHWD